MVRTSLGGHVEHMVAYAGTTFIVAFAYPQKQLRRVIIALICYAAASEFLQRFSRRQHPAIEDWLASSAGVLVGGGLTLTRHSDQGSRPITRRSSENRPVMAAQWLRTERRDRDLMA
jgi:VanZ family protein